MNEGTRHRMGWDSGTGVGDSQAGPTVSQGAWGKGVVSTSLWPQETKAPRNSSRFPKAQMQGF